MQMGRFLLKEFSVVTLLLLCDILAASEHTVGTWVAANQLEMDYKYSTHLASLDEQMGPRCDCDGVQETSCNVPSEAGWCTDSYGKERLSMRQILLHHEDIALCFF